MKTHSVSCQQLNEVDGPKSWQKPFLLYRKLGVEIIVALPQVGKEIKSQVKSKTGKLLSITQVATYYIHVIGCN